MKTENKNKMAIEKITCPVLNKGYRDEMSHLESFNGNKRPVQMPPVEVFVRFYDTEKPFSIMCPNYNSDKVCTVEGRKCIYAEWKNFKSETQGGKQ